GILAIVSGPRGGAAASATSPGAPHHSPSATADIAYGANVYAANCVTCHGPQGDGIGSVNLRSGTFRNAVTDRDLERFIRTGSAAGMPPFTLDAADTAGNGAHLRNKNAFDGAPVKARGEGGRGGALPREARRTP